ncbi:MAG: hypothetical protein K2G70_07655 [Turicibacter sp.]|nr:hypothetical protein [Turicibacter sp.]
MSDYTVELRYLIDYWYKQLTTAPARSIRSKIEEIVGVYLKPPIFNLNVDTDVSAEFNNFFIKFLSHYYTYEIGLETPEMFLFAMESKFNELLPKYTALWKTAKISNVYTNNMNISETYKGNGTHNNLENGTTTTTENNGKSSSITTNVDVTENTDISKRGNNTENKSGNHSITTTETDNSTYNDESHWTEQDNQDVGVTTENNDKAQTLHSDLPQVSWQPTLDYGSDMDRTLNSGRTQSNTTDRMEKGGDNTKKSTTNNTKNGTNKDVWTEENAISINVNDKTEKIGNTQTTQNLQDTIKNNGTIENENRIEGESTNNYTKTISGYNGVNPMEELLNTYRNIDYMFIEECAELFMQIYM